MASIQQAFNQMLGSAQLAAGFYAHTPAAEQRMKLKSAQKEIAALEKKADIETETLAPVGTGTTEEFKKFDEAYAQRATDIADAYKRVYELTPSEKAYQSYLKALEEKEFAIEQRKEMFKGGQK